MAHIRFAGIRFNFVLIGALALALVSCTFNLDPAGHERTGSVSVNLSGAATSQGNDSGRAISANSGFIYLQTGLTAETAKLYGPFPVTAGTTALVKDIPAATYPAMVLVFLPELAPAPLSPIIPSSATVDGLRLSMQQTLADSPSLSSSSSISLIENFTIVWGANNTISACLIPTTALVPNTDGFISLSPSGSGVSRRFVRLSGLVSRFASATATAEKVLTMKLSNSSADPAIITGIGLYDSLGGRLSRENVSQTLLTGESLTRTVSWTGDDCYYAYVEFTGSGVDGSFTATIVEQRSITYDGNGGSGSVTAQKGAEGTSVQLSGNGFTRAGYAFLGWSVNPAATSADYPAGYAYTYGAADVTLYAVWRLSSLPFIISASMANPSMGYPGYSADNVVQMNLSVVNAYDGIASITLSGSFSGFSPTVKVDGVSYGCTVSGTTLTFPTPVNQPNAAIVISDIILPLGNGTRSVGATITCGNGVSTTEAVATVTVESSLPTLGAYNLADALGHAHTTDGLIVIKGTIGDTGSGVYRFNLTGSVATLAAASVYVNGSSVGFTYSDSLKTVTLLAPVTGSAIPFEIRNVTLPAPSSSYSIGLTVSDAAGNVSLSSAGSITSDQTGPVVEDMAVYDSSYGDTGFTNGDISIDCNIDEDCAFYKTITVTASSGVISLADAIVRINGTQYSCTRSGNTLTLVSSPMNGYCSMTISGLDISGLSDGVPTTIRLTVGNEYGLTTTVAGGITIDLAGPHLPSLDVSNATSTQFIMGPCYDSESGMQSVTCTQQSSVQTTPVTANFSGCGCTVTVTGIPTTGGIVGPLQTILPSGTQVFYHYTKLYLEDAVGNTHAYYVERKYDGGTSLYSVAIVFQE